MNHKGTPSNKSLFLHPRLECQAQSFLLPAGKPGGTGLDDRKVPKTRHIWGDSNWMHKACIKIETSKFIPKTQKQLKTTRSKFSQTLSFFFDFLALSASSCSSMKSHLSCQTVVGLLFLQMGDLCPDELDSHPMSSNGAPHVSDVLWGTPQLSSN